MAEFDRTAFIGRFQEEAADILQRLNEDVIALEGDPKSASLIDRMLRDAHTLKGSSRMVGLVEISDIAHRLEDVMVAVRDGALAYVPAMSEHFFDALDTMVHLTEIAGTDDKPEVDLGVLNERLATLACGGCESAESDSHDSERAADESSGSKAGETDVAEGELAPYDAMPANGSEGEEEQLSAKVKQTIRVNTGQLDSLLNLISEAVITQVKYEQHTDALQRAGVGSEAVWQAWVALRRILDTTHGDSAMDSQRRTEAMTSFERMLLAERSRHRQLTDGLGEDISRGHTITSELQERGMGLRMLPVGTVFATFPRAMRELARSFGKDVDLVLEGGETELDKKVLEAINDPLIHIMRNAVDHGIETAEERVALGKPARGIIRVSARSEGDHIIIEVSDDGAGIDPDVVRAAAVRRGYITQIEADALSDRKTLFLVFERGFSTNAIITEVSGRGVGMDVVREYIVEKLKGDLNVFSTKGHGTTFRLTIPLTLAIIRALLMRVGDTTFVLPTTAIEETLLVEPDEIIKVEGRQAIRRGQRTYPLVSIAEILGVVPGIPDSPRLPVVAMGFSGQRYAFSVDEFLGEQQIVIKTLGSHLHKVENIAGVTVLGAGEIAPILNVPDLMASARRGGQRQSARVGAGKKRTSPRTVLICEDSFTTRELERSIFEAAGYKVEVASDGADGLEQLREGLRVDAVVTDVQMPRLSGFELTRAIKNDPVLSDVPVIIVTSLERDEEKAEGIKAGADGYITKSVFNQDTLLDTVDRLIR
ncbi:MAG: hybrid sensor histidine kinase/response regulator [Coriobacteriia bacterium]|jgi:two-component system chemotaxis sensor kinase CheA|nr:hybrid sensor histidine kinase/response regulator [Coriobacteriia bacterium]